MSNLSFTELLRLKGHLEHEMDELDKIKTIKEEQINELKRELRKREEESK